MEVMMGISRLQRILETEAMDSADEASAYDAMDHQAVNQRFVDDLLTAVPELAPSPDTATPGDEPSEDAEDRPPVMVLDLGTGTARIAIELCRRSPQARVMATDLAESMLNLAKINVALSGHESQIRLDKLDAKQLPHPSASWDVVISNSLLHHVPDPIEVMREAWRVVRPGGHVFLRDLARPESRDHLDALVEQYTAGESEQARAMFAASLHAALTLDEARQLVQRVGGEPLAVDATSDRHWTWTQQRPDVAAPTDR